MGRERRCSSCDQERRRDCLRPLAAYGPEVVGRSRDQSERAQVQSLSRSARRTLHICAGQRVASAAGLSDTSKSPPHQFASAESARRLAGSVRCRPNADRGKLHAQSACANWWKQRTATQRSDDSRACVSPNDGFAGRADCRARRQYTRLVRPGGAFDLGHHRCLHRSRDFFSPNGVQASKDGPFRVIGREYESTGTDRSYRIPDARVGNIAIDVTLTRKSLATPQVRGFLRSDFKPDAVVIIRPSQFGPAHTYRILRPRSSP